MTTYTGLKGLYDGQFSLSSDPASVTFGLSFKVTSANMQLDGWWWYCDISGGQGNGAEDFALWQSTGAGTGTYVASSKVSSSDFSQGWNFIPCSSPIPLTNGQEYRAVKSNNHKDGTEVVTYAHVTHLFDTGSAAAGVVNGPLTIFSAPGNATNPEPRGDGQMVFGSSGNDVTANYPSSQFNQSWYGLDVQISDVGGGGGGGTPGGGASGGLLLTIP